MASDAAPTNRLQPNDDVVPSVTGNLSTATDLQAMADSLLVTPLVAGTTSSLRTSPPVPNDAGVFQSFGPIDTSNLFFKPAGNGRACATCHQETQGWSIKPDGVQARFQATGGTDPLFRLVDGSNSPNMPVATVSQRETAYSMLLNRGVIRVGLPVPMNAEFDLVQADDPYRFASASQLSLFRRPLPTTNLKYSSTFMWDGRETFADPNSSVCTIGAATRVCFAARGFDLRNQSNDAFKGHAEAGRDLSFDEMQSIVSFEKNLFTAQISDKLAGNLTSSGAFGGPLFLLFNSYYFGINDLVAGDYFTGAPFRPNAMTLFDGWNSVLPLDATSRARASIARGQALFNSKPINISGVNGLNDVLRVATLRGTCTTCHNTPNIGTHSIPRLFATGVSAASRRTPDMPLYTFRNKATGEIIRTMDPGRALITGRWSDMKEMQALFASFGIAMLIGVLCIYGVLVLLFRDFMQPATILAALPLSIGGALVALLVTRAALSMPSMIGLVMLMGIVAKNSILLVDYAILARRAGMDRFDALVDACRKRSRPIVMTSIAMGAGMMPLALGWGADPSFRAPMAIAVIGGLITSTVLSLLVVPVVFSYVDDFEQWWRRMGCG